jgi:hypothetical protein
MANRWVIVISLVIQVLSQRPQQQWFLTGKNFNDQRNTTKYQPEIVNLWSIPQLHGRDESAINFTHSSFGGALAVFVGHNVTIDAAVERLLREILSPHARGEYQLEVVDVWHYDLLVTVSQDTPLQYEIGLYDSPRSFLVPLSSHSHLSSAQWLRYGIHQVKLGKEWRIVCNISSPSLEALHKQEVHRFVVTSDLYLTLTVTQHTWEVLTVQSPDEGAMDESQLTTKDQLSLRLRVMTFNIWHNNPPAWLLHDK